MEATTKEFYHEAKFIDQNGSHRTIMVPVVQELARHGLQDLPEMFIRPPLDSMNPSPISCPLENFPMVSLARLRATEERERAREISKLAEGAKEWGMILVSDHGIPTSLLGDVRDVVKGFFGLSFEEKKESVGTYASVDNMGYGRNFINPQKQPVDWIDRLTVKAAPQNTTHGLNVWPQKPINFRKVFESYVEKTRELCDELLQALAEGLSLEKNTFIQYFDSKTREINIRVNYYPPCPKPNLALSLNPHTDASVLSLLIQFSGSGTLQVMNKETNWVKVPWPSDALLVNVGDLLEIMSNGRLKSPWHRVIAQNDFERFSVALFFNPPLVAEIEPVKSDDLSDGEYKKVVVGDYVQHFYKISPTKFKEAIKFAMV